MRPFVRLLTSTRRSSLKRISSSFKLRIDGMEGMIGASMMAAGATASPLVLCLVGFEDWMSKATVRVARLLGEGCCGGGRFRRGSGDWIVEGGAFVRNVERESNGMIVVSIVD